MSNFEKHPIHRRKNNKDEWSSLFLCSCNNPLPKYTKSIKTIFYFKSVYVDVECRHIVQNEQKLYQTFLYDSNSNL